jgi:hypothetical protein
MAGGVPRAATREAGKRQATADRRGAGSDPQGKAKADSDLRSRKGQVAKRERDLKQSQDGARRDRSRILDGSATRLAECEKDWRAARRSSPPTASGSSSSSRRKRASRARLGLTRDEARRQLLANLKAEARFEAARRRQGDQGRGAARGGGRSAEDHGAGHGAHRLGPLRRAHVTRFALPSAGRCAAGSSVTKGRTSRRSSK